MGKETKTRRDDKKKPLKTAKQKRKDKKAKKAGKPAVEA